MRKKINYIVPYINDYGGIQEFAKTVSKKTNETYSIELFDYQYKMSNTLEKILDVAPRRIGEKYFQFIKSDEFKYTYFGNNPNLLHFWHVDAAIYFLKAKYVLTCHGLEILRISKNHLKSYLYKKAINNALIITADSKYTQDLLITNYKVNPKKIILVNPCIDTSHFTQKKIKKSKLIIGTLARLVQRKNIPTVIKALEILHSKYKIDFTYLLAGTGEEKNNILRQLKKTKISWKYLGEVNKKEKIDFYRSIDIFAMTPVTLKDSVEGFGIVYIEANCFGIPNVASKSGGIVDAVKNGQSGLFVNPEDPEDIAKSLLNLTKNLELYESSSKKWAKTFDVSIISKKFENVYEKALRENGTFK